MACWGDGSVMPQGLILARDHCASICSLLLFPHMFLSPLVFCCPYLSSQIAWFVYLLALSSVLLPSFCPSTSVSLLSLSHVRKQLHTVMHPAFICLNAHCWPLLLFCAENWLCIAIAYHHCTQMLPSTGNQNHGLDMQHWQDKLFTWLWKIQGYLRMQWK